MKITQIFTVPSDSPVPIEDVTPGQWLQFVAAIVRQDHRIPESETASRFGIFDFSPRRLCDLGVMQNAKYANERGRLVCHAQWKPPNSLLSFLADRHRQYSLFCESITRYSEETDLLNRVGTPCAGKRATLSGILALAHRLGAIGACKWLSDPRYRAGYSDTLTLYEKVTGIF